MADAPASNRCAACDYFHVARITPAGDSDCLSLASPRLRTNAADTCDAWTAADHRPGRLHTVG